MYFLAQILQQIAKQIASAELLLMAHDVAHKQALQSKHRDSGSNQEAAADVRTFVAINHLEHSLVAIEPPIEKVNG